MTDNDLDLSQAVRYHWGGFPPAFFDLATVIEPLLRATDALARYLSHFSQQRLHAQGVHSCGFALHLGFAG